VDGRLAARQHQGIDLAALARDRDVECREEMIEPGVLVDAGPAGGEAGRALEVAGLGDIEQEDAGVLRLEIAEPVQITHRDRPDIRRPVWGDLARRDPPLLEPFPEADVLLVEADDLTVPALAGPAKVDRAVLGDEVALEDVGLVVEVAVRILAEAGPADRQDHPEGRVWAERQGGGHQNAPAALPASAPAMQAPLIPTRTATEIASAEPMAKSPVPSDGAR
jgi:hypothetical protein